MKIAAPAGVAKPLTSRPGLAGADRRLLKDGREARTQDDFAALAASAARRCSRSCSRLLPASLAAGFECGTGFIVTAELAEQITRTLPRR